MTAKTKSIPISTYQSNAETEDLVLQVLRSGQLAQGPMVERLEELSCIMSGASHAVAVANGTMTLIASLMAHDIGPGDEVITSPFTFVATINAILFTGAKVIFVDIEESTYNLDASIIEDAITPNTKAIMPVHIFGQMCDMTKISELAVKYGLSIIEDSAQAHGASWNDKNAGSYGTGSFSFYTTKNIGCGEGGVVTTNDAEIARNIRLIRNQGMQERYKYERVGWNMRLTDLQAAVAIPQLEKLDETNKKRNNTAEQYLEVFNFNINLMVPKIKSEAYSVWHQFSLRATDTTMRDTYVEKLNAMGIGSGVYYPRPVFDYMPYQDNPLVQISDCPVTDLICKSVFSIPIHHYLNSDDVNHIIDGVSQVTA
ncbi:MAG: DegT/DnrJ/EryC1/StrS family aminotransferase [Acidimicrobiia bacterium]